MSRRTRQQSIDVELVTCPTPDGSGQWYWCVRVEQMVHAEGFTSGPTDAFARALDVYLIWRKGQEQSDISDFQKERR